MLFGCEVRSWAAAASTVQTQLLPNHCTPANNVLEASVVISSTALCNPPHLNKDDGVRVAHADGCL